MPAEAPVAVAASETPPLDEAPVEETNAVFADEAAAVATDVPEAAEMPVPGTSTAEAPAEGAPAWLAALIGVLIGAIGSLVLLRERLVGALRNLLPGRARFISPVDVPEAEETSRPASRRMLPAESTMVVVEGHGPESGFPSPEHAAPPPPPAALPPAPRPASRQIAQPESLDSELADLFSVPTDETVLAADVGLASPSQDLDLDLTAASSDVTLDQDIGWIGDETALTPTQEVSAVHPGGGGDTVEQVDLQTLSQRAADDAQISQTLKDALNLLESDYEDELTASQVIDRAKLQQVLDESEDDTLVRTGTDRTRR
jgi:hypothetical protein